MPLALGLDSARSLNPARYGAPDRTPRFAVRPASREEVAEALRAAARDQLTVIPFGGPPEPSRLPELPPFDIALDLSALDRVVEYEPEDLSVTAECGVTLATLRGTLAARGQSLTLVPSWSGPLGLDMAGDVLLPGPDARIMPTTFDQWLAAI